MRLSMPLCLLFLLLVLPLWMQAQTSADVDRLKRLLQAEKQDTARVGLLLQLSNAYAPQPDTSLLLAQQALVLSRKAGFALGEVRSLNGIANEFWFTGNYPKALALYLEGLRKAERIADEVDMSRILGNIGNVYTNQGDYRQAISYMSKALALSKRIDFPLVVLINLINLGDAYEKSNLLDSAKLFTEQGYQMAVRQNNIGLIGLAFNNLGNIYSKLGQTRTALTNYRAGIPFLLQAEGVDALSETYLGMAKLFQKEGRADSSLHYAKRSLTTAQQSSVMNYVLAASNFLSTYYKDRYQLDSAYAYLSTAVVAKDSLFSQEKARQIQTLSYEETMRQQQIEQARAEARTQLKLNALLGGLFTLGIVAFLLYRNSRQKQKAKVKIETAYDQLKATQQQLIHTEKMASLGELTAGIAHEIQNPLNFVNNFSETNKELIDEIEQANQKGDPEEVRALLVDLRANEEKVNHHGKRADAIVRGMLQHARATSGRKEYADVNKLVDEYLRLSFQGTRAKDKNFNARIETSFDERVGNVNLNAQDIGRVLLNIFNNAFYAVNEKKLHLNGAFEPIIFVSTKREDDHVTISVSDNGTGISQKLVDKIFQPFFTTKPTGEGTGLGLSLSYDIVTKGHGGTLSVQSVQGEGSEFMVTLPTG